MAIKVILTGATGMVGEGVLLTCLEHPDIEEVLMVNRRPSPVQHAKLKELIVPDFSRLDDHTEQLKGYDACFYCAGISSVGMDEAKYSAITYDTTIHFARKLVAGNPDMVFNFVSGSHTDSSERGKVMWARVKGKTENTLQTIGFKAQYNFRPGAMKQVAGQQNAKLLYRVLVSILSVIWPRQVCSIRDVGLAMIRAAITGYPASVLEVKDIKILARS